MKNNSAAAATLAMPQLDLVELEAVTGGKDKRRYVGQNRRVQRSNNKRGKGAGRRSN